MYPTAHGQEIGSVEVFGQFNYPDSVASELAIHSRSVGHTDWEATKIAFQTNQSANKTRHCAGKANGHAPPGLQVVLANSVEPQPIEWIWPGRLAKGKLTLITGDPGVGKSQITCDIAARISVGSAWPDGGNAPLGQVYMMSAEDSLKDTINPRLQAAGADLGKVHIIESVGENNRQRSVNLQHDVQALSLALAKLPNTRLLVVDPFPAYLGDIDSHRSTDVRATLEPLAKMAEIENIAIVAVTHPPKAAQVKAIHAVSGSLAFVAAARIVLLAVQEPERDRYLLLCAKNNLAAFPAGLGYSIQQTIIPQEIGTSRIVWDGAPVHISANEAISATGIRDPGKLQLAVEWLRSELIDEPKSATATIEKANREGITKRTLDRARSELGVIAKKSGFQGEWEWHLV